MDMKVMNVYVNQIQFISKISQKYHYVYFAAAPIIIFAHLIKVKVYSLSLTIMMIIIIKINLILKLKTKLLIEIVLNHYLIILQIKRKKREKN